MYFRFSKLAALTALCMTCLLFLCACADEEDAAPVEQEQVAEMELADLEKWNAYVDLYNESYVLQEKIQGYFKELGASEIPVVTPAPDSALRPDGREGPELQWLVSPEVMERLETLSARVARLSGPDTGAEPAGELDRKAAVYAVGLERLRKLLSDAQSYYQGGGYLRDDLAQGREIHLALQAAVLRFEPLDRDFARALKVEERRRQVWEAAELRKQGLRILPAAIEFGLAAQDVRDEFLRQGVDASNIQALDLATLQPLYQDLSAALRQLDYVCGIAEQPGSEGLSRQKAEALLLVSRELTASVGAIISSAEVDSGMGRGAGETTPAGSAVTGPLKVTPENFYPLMARFTRQYNQIITGLQQ